MTADALRRAGRRVLTATVLLILLNASPGCGIGYVASSGTYQMELLNARVPLDEARQTGGLDAQELEALELVEDVKRFGVGIGLAGTHNFETVALDWDRTIYNVSACDPVSFEQKTWWFPIVGTVPYLGYFTRDDAIRAARPLREEGWDVFVRTAGAYSTLGWFEDPLLRPMLKWDAYWLINVVLHETTHATVWVNGGVRFNESFAAFVGDVAAFRYIAARHGEDSEAWAKARAIVEDDDRWRRLLLDLYNELDAVYNDPELDVHDKVRRKLDLLSTLPRRILRAHFHNATPFLHAALDGKWNNARIAQFKDYNTARDHFAALLDAQDGDLLAFVQAVQQLAEDADDPFVALEAAATALPTEASAP